MTTRSADGTTLAVAPRERLTRLPRPIAACVWLAGILALATTFVGAQAPSGRFAPRVAADGLVRSELSLGGRTAILAYTPSLSASDAAHVPLLSASPTVGGGRVRIGHLDTTGPLQIGTVSLGQGAGGAAPAGTSPSPAPPLRYDLWLEGADQGWHLHITDSANASLGQVELPRQPAPSSSPMLIGALVPENATSGRLTINWGGYRSAAEITFPNPTRRRLDENRTPNETVNRRHNEDTSALSRARLLAQRSETAIVFPEGERMSLSFQRTFGRAERVEGNRNSRGLTVDGPDFARLMQTPVGHVVLLTESPVPRLRVERPLRFETTTLALGNQVAGFPGSYGLWLKRAGAGWKLVFSHEPDVWGSQHDPKTDAAEVDLTHSEGGAADRPFAAAIVPTGPDRGRLAILWGPHEWSADFVLAPR
ncbi:MAG: DUF2911 domain-containing protein [Acidimicrobiia bacterium]|nr:DUF2911 domain-containing protein [Acidimicrobiia bacterium]